MSSSGHRAHLDQLDHSFTEQIVEPLAQAWTQALARAAKQVTQSAPASQQTLITELRQALAQVEEGPGADASREPLHVKVAELDAQLADTRRLLQSEKDFKNEPEKATIDAAMAIHAEVAVTLGRWARSLDERDEPEQPPQSPFAASVLDDW